LAAGLGLAALASHALSAPRPGDWTACFVTHGVLLVPAQMAGLTGLFILDTGTAESVLDATQASLAGLDAGEAKTPLRFGGRYWATVAVSVAALDARTRTQPTPITGVVGADVLRGLVLEVRPDPCRFRLTARALGEAGQLARLRVTARDGVPYVVAGLSDGEKTKRGLMRVSTGAELAVRLNPGEARLAGARGGSMGPVAPLRALSLGDVLVENPEGEIAGAADGAALGEIGEPIWSAYGFQLDLGRGRLTLFSPPRK
jgi:hypothetical protein